MTFAPLLGVLISSFIITAWVRRTALRQQLLDIPNERSSHTRPTPRGGGIGFVVAFLALVALLFALGDLPLNHAAALIIGGALIAIVGYVDDRRSLSAQARLVMQIIAGVIGVALIGGMPPLDLGFARIEWGIVGHVIGVIGVVWLINLYNFMDGIDGIAAGEAVIVAGAVGVFYLVAPALTSAANTIPLLIFGLAAACLGFLVWNWSPARIFMGDVGSGFLGYVLGLLALLTAHLTPLMLWIWLILLAVFVVDTLLTLINRVRRGETWHQAHRSHAYQHATMRYRSHARVTTTVLLITLLWLTPLAWLALHNPPWVIAITLLAYAPIIALALVFKAGIEPYAVD